MKNNNLNLFPFMRVRLLLNFLCLSGFLVLFFLDSCKSADETVQLRIKNSSAYIYTNVVVNTSGGENIFGNINPGMLSEYKIFDFAYSYAYIKLQVNSVDYILQPIDYTGGQKLKSGKYTYDVSVSDTISHQLSLSLTED